VSSVPVGNPASTPSPISSRAFDPTDTRVLTRRTRGLLVAACFGLGALACDRSEPAGAPAASTSSQPKTPDRLAPGEIAEGKTDLFGLRLPRDLKVEARFPHSGYASGKITPEALSNYVRKRVDVRHVELAASRTVFPKARIKGADAERRFRIEVIPLGRRSKLMVQWLNPPRPPAAKGLSEAERWKQAGLTPDGKQLNPQELE